MDVEYLDWDSSFFGYKVGKIIEIVDPYHLTLTLQACKKEGYKLIYLFYNEPLETDICNTDKHQITFVDQKATFGISIKADSTISLSPYINVYNETFVAKELYDLSIQSGGFSRFKYDKKIGQDTFEKMYKLWIENSVNKKLADVIFIYKYSEMIQGFVALKVQNQIGIIKLIAVDKQLQGKNIGSQLINAVKNYLIDSNIFYIEVVTQEANKQAYNFYIKNGFNIIKKEFIYHCWL